jgi:hypothetical protein
MSDELSKNQSRIFVKCLKLTKMIFGEFLSMGHVRDRRMPGDRDQSSSNSKHVFPASMSFFSNMAAHFDRGERRVRYLFTEIS